MWTHISTIDARSCRTANRELGVQRRLPSTGDPSDANPCWQRQWWVIDLGSTNGTFVNEEKIDRAELRPGDHVRIGGFEFEVPANDAEPNG